MADEKQPKKPEPVEAPILLEMAKRGGCATWGELKAIRKKPGISDNAIKLAIRSLTKKGLMVARADLINEKAVTKYCLTQPLPGVYIEGETKPLLEYLEGVHKKLKAARRKDLKALKLSPHDIEKWGGLYPETSEAALMMCEALSESLQALDVFILDLIAHSWRTCDEVEAMRELDAGCKLLVVSLITEIAEMAHPRYSDVDKAVHCAKVVLGRAYDRYAKDGKEAIEKGLVNNSHSHDNEHDRR